MGNLHYVTYFLSKYTMKMNFLQVQIVMTFRVAQSKNNLWQTLIQRFYFLSL